MTIKIFFIGKDRIFAEFDNNNKDCGFHIIDNHNNIGKLITKKIYKKIRKKTGYVVYHDLNVSRYLEKQKPHQIINI